MITGIAVWLLASPAFALICGRAIHIRDMKETLK